MFSFSYLLPCLGLTLGTANTLVYMKGKGVIMNEPTVVAMKGRPQGHSGRRRGSAADDRPHAGRHRRGAALKGRCGRGLQHDRDDCCAYFIRKAVPQGFAFHAQSARADLRAVRHHGGGAPRGGGCRAGSGARGMSRCWMSRWPPRWARGWTCTKPRAA